ncbi:ATP-binding cassette transporter yor1 [Exophiala dermatitidis]|uniref:ABC multidrug transporter n=2 Tax=Exophiala dermatitidis TaxID=5970 RepID=H6BLL3_EXODN|nr:ABC multidrug transporter [Exophiala dermatitidis NIH/UT8656]KAJ4518012.1 ATP-binding cassette transporter yor1 [Exophiala dermatitidis]EHY51906.1 ABC multidrug transporter [Exophiala dermatitidis NIH/UT8656]KAJ4520911.1 ATP-binding cassette transporter yor1 [Exophiala dermatitidis]KAJ4547486.1 ATP-binding cassette transporter yor1 [Exophiala dermatitidis]KAJ4553240.1 ATP-binding cassette transporter yor1 [Exophiala dermatitidis]
MARPEDGDEHNDLNRALTQDRVEEAELAEKDEPRQYLEVPKENGGLDRSSSEESTRLRKIESTATSATEASTAVHPQPYAQEKAPWYRRLNPLRRGPPPPIPEERGVSREYTAGFLSLLTFQWMNPLMTTGYKRPIELNDIWLVNPDRSSATMMDKLMPSFKRRVARGERNPLVWALFDTFRGEFLLGGTCALFSAMLQVFSPFTTRYLIQFATDAWIADKTGSKAPNIGHGVGLVIGITFMQICQSVSTNHFLYRGMVVGGEARAVLINAIFEKSLVISGRAKAGGKALDDEQTSNGISEADDGRQSEKSKKRPFLARSISRKLHPKGGPNVTPDKAVGVAGDGTGWNNGKIVNLMSVDTYRVDQASGMFHIIWTSPLQVIVVLVVLIVNLGYSALAGYALLMIMLPLLTKAIKSLFARRKRINKITDQRVTLTQEILGSVRFVKFFGWETSFLDRLKELRKREIRSVQILLSIRNAINAVAMSMPVFASMLAFITYSLSDHGLSPARVFSSLALFNSLRMPLNLLPLVLGQVTDAQTALHRIQEFLLSEEQKDEVIWDENMEDAVEVQHASFTWERSATQDKEKTGAFQTKGELMAAKKAEKQKKKAQKKADKTAKKNKQAPRESTEDGSSETTQAEPFKLHDIDFTVGRNELIAVIGTVGSGKTSLLAALAGDMRKTSGKVKMASTRAFCPQYAWIQNATLKDNILFGKRYKSKWYRDVIDACALAPDLEILPAGDQTEIGERGITLSGGQKQRLNIARAIYFDADIILMDDPLSAVDAHVGRHIMDKAICGLMKNKCRILATHQLHVLSRCDRIIWMEDGHIQAIDTYDNLMQQSVDFQKLMATTAQEDSSALVKAEEAEETEEKPEKKIKKGKPAALMQQEERAVKSVSWTVWKAYFAASGSPILWPLIFVALILSQGSNIATSLWLSWWVSDKFGFSEGAYIGAYAGLGLSQALLLFTFSTILSTSGTNASRVMLQRAMTRVLRAPMSFFDTTPLGRITNRFSKDVDSMDNSLTDAMRMYFLTLAMITSVFALIIAYFHYFAVALGPLFILFLFASSYYRSSAREIKRHEAVLRSNVFARFSESISGVASIRAYGLQKYFVSRVRNAMDEMDSAYFLTFANQRWLSTRLDAIGNILVFVTGILVVTDRFNVNPSIAGLVLSYILAIVQMIQFTVRQLAEVENNMNATERIHYYGTQLEQEAPLKLRDVPDSWPDKGAITFDKVEMRYRPELPLVLKGLDFQIAGGEKIGIVGRTGAGKSSIMSALFRLTELSSGQIKIDGIDIATVGLYDLRSRLAIIPQDPTLFRGTIRSNLDPFNEHSDLELWAALRKADLVGEEMPSTPTEKETRPQTTETAATSSSNVNAPASQSRIQLDSPVEEEGLNFSLGQRQLMALARALVRNSQIIVCDEATSSVDFETDEKIQRTMRTAFSGKTLLCIAHRLKTIINYDRICVMDQGRIAELDTPINLFEANGIFRSMCDKSQIVREDFFRER